MHFPLSVAAGCFLCPKAGLRSASLIISCPFPIQGLSLGTSSPSLWALGQQHSYSQDGSLGPNSLYPQS